MRFEGIGGAHRKRAPGPKRARLARGRTPARHGEPARLARRFVDGDHVPALADSACGAPSVGVAWPVALPAWPRLLSAVGRVTRGWAYLPTGEGEAPFPLPGA